MISLAQSDETARRQLTIGPGVRTISDISALRRLAKQAMLNKQQPPPSVLAAPAPAIAAPTETPEAVLPQQPAPATRTSAASTGQPEPEPMDLDDIPCMTCHGRDSHPRTRILLCSSPGCPNAQHKHCAGLRCLPPASVPWFCPPCSRPSAHPTGQPRAPRPRRPRHYLANNQTNITAIPSPPLPPHPAPPPPDSPPSAPDGVMAGSTQ